MKNSRSRSLLFSLLLAGFGLAGSFHGWAKDEIEFSDETKIHQDLVQVALGKSPADMIVHNVTMLNVFTEQWQPGQDIVIKSKHIAWVGPQGQWKGKCNNIMDATGATVVPGFGESHKHLESTNLTPEYEGALVYSVRGDLDDGRLA